MIKYSIRRILLTIPLLLVVLTIVFVFVRLAPGDPAIAMLGQYATQEALEALRTEMGLDAPMWLQYLRFLGNLLRGDLGVSMLNGVPVVDQLRVVLPYTLELTLSAMLIGVILGVPMGVYTALNRNRGADYSGRMASLAGISIPSFYLGILLLYAFSVRMNLFPVIGAGADNSISDRLHHLVLPSLSLGLIMTSYVMRLTRSSMLNVLNEDFVRTAKSKGLRERVVVYKHGLMNALIPVVSVLGIYFIINLGSSIMTEIVFSRPGLGKLMVMAMKQRDYVMLQSVMVVYATLAIFINLFVDLIYGFIDPRIKYG
ncbi:MAG: ABC transporter permease [Deltaproteobacteria bacterium]|nr:ABC transporter permease [Deltaproteobacteria bacterium]